jgi:hypothetical protein
VKLFFAGAYKANEYDPILKWGVKNLELNYFGFYSEKRSLAAKLAGFDNVQVLLNATPKESAQKEWAKDKIESFIEEYVTYIKHNRSRIYAAIELDYPTATRYQVLKWREEYYYPLTRDGIDIIYTWNDDIFTHRDFSRLLRYCNYFALQGSQDNAKNLVSRARRDGIRVHGLGVASFDILASTPYYYVDTTAWLAGRKYGNLLVWENRKMISLDRTEKGSRKHHVKYFESIGLSTQKIIDDDTQEVLHCNVLSLLKLEEYMSNKNREIDTYLVVQCKQPTQEEQKAIDSTRLLSTIDSRAESLVEQHTEVDKKSKPKAPKKGVGRGNYKRRVNRWAEGKGPKKQALEPTIVKEEISEESINGIGVMIGSNVDFTNSVSTRLSMSHNIDSNILDHNGIDNQNDLGAVPGAEVRNSASVAERTAAITLFQQEASRLGLTDKLPPLLCDNCVVESRCQKYQQHSVCAYRDEVSKFQIRNAGDIIAAMKGIFEAGIERVQNGMIIEKVDGGAIDKQLNVTMNNVFEQGKLLFELTTGSKSGAQDTITIKASGKGLLKELFSKPK